MEKQKNRKIKMLAISDVHGDSELTKRLAEKAEKEKVDLVLLCGDNTSPFETEDLIKPFKKKNKDVLIIPGNHDSFATTEFIANLYGIKNLHGYSIIHNGIGFFGAGGADIGPGAISENELFRTLKKAHSGLEKIKTKIMITHQHQKGSNSELSGVKGSEAVTKAIKEFKPDILIHGHIHEAEGIEEIIGNTKVINVGRKGRIIEI